MSAQNSKMLQNTTILLITDFCTRFLGALLTIVIARKLGAASLGILAFALSFTELFGFLTRFGFKHLISRDVAQDISRTGRYMGSVFMIEIILSFVVLFIVVALSDIMNLHYEKLIVILIMAVILILTSLITIFHAFFRAYQMVQYESFIRLLLNLISVVSGLVVLFLGYGLITLVSVRLIVYILLLLFGFQLLIKKIGKPHFTKDWQFHWTLIQAAVPFAVLGIVVSFNTQIGTVLLSIIKGDMETGWYSAAIRLVGVFSFMPTAFVGSVLPAMSKFSYKRKENHLNLTFERTLKYLFILSLPMSIGLFCLSEKIIQLIYGSDFQSSVNILRIVGWFLVFSFLNHGCMIGYAAIGQEKRFVRNQIWGTMIALVMNLSLIPWIGGLGLAIVAVFSQIVIFSLSMISLSRFYRLSRFYLQFLKPSLVGLIMGIFLRLLYAQSLFVLIGCGAILYGFGLALSRTFKANELTTIRFYINSKFKIKQ